jgi:hypothetical protein
MNEDILQRPVGIHDYGLGLHRRLVLALALRIRRHVDYRHRRRFSREQNAAGHGARRRRIDVSFWRRRGRL